MRPTRLLPALAVLALLLALPSIAGASTLVRSGGDYTYTGSSSSNSVTIQAGSGSISVSDIETITMAADASCTGENTNTITCSVQPTSISSDSGGGNDFVNIGSNSIPAFNISSETGSGDDNNTIGAQFTSGTSSVTETDSSGNDTLQLTATSVVGTQGVGFGIASGGTGNDNVSSTGTANGDGGNDILHGNPSGSASVTLNGGTENDLFDMNDGTAELVNGGAGTDTVQFNGGNNYTVTLDAVQNDGPPGQTVDNANADSSVEAVRTGQGKDTITGSAAGDQLFSGPGDDVVNGGGGSDTMDGGTGSDVINGNSNGGAGDTVLYTDRVNPVNVTLDSVADDGEIGERDKVQADVENVFTGYGDDNVVGTTTANNIQTGLGADTVDTGDGTDTVLGGPGDDNIDGGNQNDTLDGGSGDDTLAGGNGNDGVIGGSGADLIDGGGNNDTLEGDSGSDTLLSRDGTGDTVNCGEETDHAVHDVAGDTINADCEISDTGAAGFGSDPISDQTPLISSSNPQATVGGTNDLAVVTCTSKRLKKSGRVTVKCTVALSDSKSASKVRAKLVRGKRIVARGKRAGSGTLTLRSAKRAKAGRYTLVVTRDGAAVARIKIRVR